MKLLIMLAAIADVGDADRPDRRQAATQRFRSPDLPAQSLMRRSLVSRPAVGAPCRALAPGDAPHAIGVEPADRLLAAVGEPRDPAARRIAREAGDEVPADDRRAVQPDEQFRIEPFLQRRHRMVDQPAARGRRGAAYSRARPTPGRRRARRSAPGRSGPTPRIPRAIADVLAGAGAGPRARWRDRRGRGRARAAAAPDRPASSDNRPPRPRTRRPRTGRRR